MTLQAVRNSTDFELIILGADCSDNYMACKKCNAGYLLALSHDMCLLGACWGNYRQYQMPNGDTGCESCFIANCKNKFE